MMICPQCKLAYGDDFVYCLNDGNALIDDGVEQETVLNARQPDRIEFPIPPQNASQNSQANDETVGFVSPVFTPPTPPVTNVPPANNNVLIITLATVSILVLTGIFFMMGGGGFKTDNDQLTRSINANRENLNADAEADKADKVDDNSAANTNFSFADNRPLKKEVEEMPSLPDKFEREYKGYSNRPLTLSLKKDGYSLSGTANTPGDWDELQGTIQPDGTFDMTGNNRGYGITGHWRGRIRPNGSIRGVWTATNGRRVSYSAAPIQ